ncbi:hypothetical protein AB1K62_09815 [Parasphingorhabdus sp. JC815]|uniref:hypothetical protein n=1 Tax=Parasphingorhabdus sp. JC815 TaxID=3232140 RepID=UPI003459B3DF
MTIMTASASKGAPLKSLLIILVFWVSIRIIWESIFPSSVAPTTLNKLTAMKDYEISTDTVSLTDTATLTAQPILQERAGNPPYLSQSKAAYMQPALMPGTSQQREMNQSKSSAMLVAAPVVSSRHIVQRQDNLVPSPTGFSPSSKPLSGYFWAFVRQSSGSERFGSGAPALQSPGGQYGGSQAGAILTYRLAGTQQNSLSAYMRASTAISLKGQEELAFGVRARPFDKLPVFLFAEQRMGPKQIRNRGTSFFVAGGTEPARLATDLSLETYGQAGFLFAKQNSYFFDASANVQRKLWEKGGYKLTAGGGVWAGGQKGLTRVDVGPRANIHIPVGTMDMRFSLDWRQRIGGNAAPDSGPAMTVTTGF